MEERRKAPRFLALFEIKYASEGKVSFRSKSKSKNVSKIGLRLPIYRLIKPGTKLKLEIEVPEIKKTVVASGKVVWTRKMPDDIPPDIDAGLKFTTIEERDLDEMVRVAREG